MTHFNPLQKVFTNQGAKYQHFIAFCKLVNPFLAKKALLGVAIFLPQNALFRVYMFTLLYIYIYIYIIISKIESKIECKLGL